jgi:hypothetical protein
MSKEIIAVIRLSTGEVGYYDELSRIHLTIGNPQKEVVAGTNCTQLRRSVKSGRLRLLSGSLGEEKKLDFGKKGNKFAGAPVEVAPTVTLTPVVETAPIVEEVTPVVEEVEAPIIEEAPVVEEVVIEAPVVEDKKAKGKKR